MTSSYYQIYYIDLYIGDCCLPSINCEYGNECICHEDGTRHPEDSCNSWFIGDGICDDYNNREICLYDEGSDFKSTLPCPNGLTDPQNWVQIWS